MRRQGDFLPAFFCGGLYLILSLYFQAHGITGGDSGDMVTAAVTGGIAHPPGYPLYSLLGFLLGKLPLYTPAWRVGLISSVFHSATISIVFLITFLCTKRTMTALYSCIVLGSTYLFFYYSITPEVFALLNFFLALLIYIFLLWTISGEKKYFFIFVFIFFFSLSHHHLILFSLPAFIIEILLIRKRNPTFLQVTLKDIFYVVLLGCIGLLPYVYIPLAAGNNPIIYWNKPDNLHGFLRLVSRADYGTFQSGGFYGQLPSQRILAVKTFIRFLVEDFKLIGVIIAFVGFIILTKKNSKIFTILSILFVSFGPLFFFYASFPLTNDFTIGTYERFLLPSYLVMAIYIGVGVFSCLNIINKFLNNYITNSTLKILSAGLLLFITFLYPVRLLHQTLTQNSGIRDDMTANYLGIDVLSQTKPNAIIILSGDTMLFNTQYARYALHVRSDTAVFHANALATDYYPQIIQRVFPEITIPEKVDKDFFGLFLQQNLEKRPIYANEKHKIPDGLFWVPNGLLYQLTKKSELPTLDALATQSAKIFSDYHDPYSGILKNHKHFMLSDVPDTYAQAAQQMGNVFLRGGLPAEAKKYYKKAVELSLESSLSINYMYLGVTQFFLNECTDALASFATSRSHLKTGDDTEILGYEIATYRECIKDEKKVEEYLKKYDESKREKEKSLKQWQ